MQSDISKFQPDERILAIEREYLALRGELDFYRKIMSVIPAFLQIRNLQTEQIKWVNDAAETMCGHKKEDMLQNPDFLMNNIVEADISWWAQSVKEYKEDRGVYSYLYSMRNADGTVKKYHGMGVVFDRDADGKPLHNLSIEIDITNEIKNYDQLKRHLDELTQKLNKQAVECLTKTEKSIIKQLCEGKSQKQIAKEIHRSKHTIDSHIRNIFKKMGVKKTSQLTLKAKEIGLV